jgi:hypothetical protein
MRQISAFRGTSGEVVSGFLNLGTLFTLVPVFTVTAGLVALVVAAVALAEAPSWLVLPLLLVATSPVTGLFAMAARAGDLEAGFFECLANHRGAVPGFVLRHATLTLAWGIPVGVGMSASASVLSQAAGSLVFGGGGEAQGIVLASLALAALLLALLLLPILTLLVATRADSLGECFSTLTWRWVLVERRADAWVMVASTVGAAIVFCICLLPVAALFVAVLAATSPEAAATAGVLAYLSPGLASIILSGRMAGAFTLADFLPPVDAAPACTTPKAPSVSVAQVQVVPAASSVPRPSGVEPPAAAPHESASSLLMSGDATVVTGVRIPSPAGRPAPALGLALARIRERMQTDPEGALSELEALAAAHPRSPAVLHDFAMALRAASRIDEACTSAGRAIQPALLTGAGPVAREVFTAFRGEADRLGLDAKGYDQVARMLLAGNDPEGAAWCHRAAASLGGDSAVAQKGLLAAADRAIKAGDAAAATAILRALVDEFSASPMTEEAAARLSKLQRRH